MLRGVKMGSQNNYDVRIFDKALSEEEIEIIYKVEEEGNNSYEVYMDYLEIMEYKVDLNNK